MPGAPAGKIVGQLKLKVLPDTSDFAKRLKAFAERMEKTIRIELPVSIDEKHAMSELLALKAKLEAVASADDVDIPVDVDGSKAKTGMLSILAQLHGMADAMPSISAGGGQVTQLLGRWSAIVGIVGVAILALGPALATVVPFAFGLVAGGLAVFAAWDQVKKLFATLAPQWKALKAAVGPALVQGLQPLVTAIGSKLFPILTKGLTQMATVFNIGFKSLAQFLTSGPGLATMKKAFDAIATAMQPFANLLTPLVRVFLGLSIAAAPALKLIGDSLVDLTSRFADFLASGSATSTITQSVKDVGAIFKIIGQVSAAVFPAIFAAVKAMIPVFQGMVPVVQVLGVFFKPLFDLLAKMAPVLKVVGFILAAVGVAFALIASPVFAIVAGIAALVAIGTLLVNNWGKIKAFGVAMWASIVAAVKVAWTATKAAVVAGVTAVGNKIKAGWNKVKAFTQAGWNLVVAYIKLVWIKIPLAILSGILKVYAYIRAIPGKVLGFLSRLPGDLLRIGGDMARGLLNGIQRGWHAVTTWVTNAINKIPAAIRHLLGINSPSRVLATIGRFAVQGFVVGMESQQKALNRAATKVFNIDPSVGLGSVFNPSFSAGVTASLTSQVGAIVDNTTNGAQEIFLNWATGRGVMRRIAQTTLASKEFQARQDALLAGAPA